MLAEIARKREDLANARAEAARRELEAVAPGIRDREGRDYVSVHCEARGTASDR